MKNSHFEQDSGSFWTYKRLEHKSITELEWQYEELWVPPPWLKTALRKIYVKVFGSYPKGMQQWDI